MIIYEYVDGRGWGVISRWRDQELQAAERTKLEVKIDNLEAASVELVKHLVHGTPERSIFKLKIKGNRQLRPLLCYGTEDPQSEITFLVAAFEIGNKFDPPNALELAVRRRAEIRDDPGRRGLYEQETGDTH